MNSIVQLLSFLVSFVYGCIFYWLTRFNYGLLKDKKVTTKFIVTLVFIVDIVIIYIYLLYKINHGYFHIYFVLMLILGFSLMNVWGNKIINFCQKYVKKMKKK